MDILRKQETFNYEIGWKESIYLIATRNVYPCRVNSFRWCQGEGKTTGPIFSKVTHNLYLLSGLLCKRKKMPIFVKTYPPSTKLKVIF